MEKKKGINGRGIIKNIEVEEKKKKEIKFV